MRLALEGKSGLIEDVDYRGATVTAAFYPLDSMGMGLVVKQDTWEFQNPYRVMAFTDLSILLLLIALCTLFFQLRWININ
jgi:hypothetical protein